MVYLMLCLSCFCALFHCCWQYQFIFFYFLALSVLEITPKHRAVVSSNVRNEKHAVKDLE